MKSKILPILLIPLLFIACKQNEPEEINPLASFEYTQDGLTVSFVNKSTNANSYLWAFGDGSTSSEKDPIHTYTQEGEYTILLSVRNITKTNQRSIQITVSKQESQPVAKFTCKSEDLKVSFTNISTNAMAYQWDFGDGFTSYQKDPVHTYKQEGSYTVSLTATNIYKSDTYTLKVDVSYRTPEASFSYITEQPFYVYLTNTSKNAESYLWEFGDGTTSTEKNPLHQYAGIGVYKIKLTAKNGTKTAYYEKNITLEAPTTCYIKTFEFNKVPTNNCYYQLQLTDDYTFSKTTYLCTSWVLLSSANLPYDYTLANAKKIDTSKDYVLRLYKSTTTPSESQASGKGDFRASITSQQLSKYPVVLKWSESNVNIWIYFIWE